MFTDIENSARMTEALGEVFRSDMRSDHCRRVRAAVAKHHGFEVETAGDSFLIVFDHADAALAFAVAIQNALTQSPVEPTAKGGRPWSLRVRLGIHTAHQEIMPQVDEATGRVCYASYSDVNFAARVMGLAAGGQILVSDSTYHAASSRDRYEWLEWANRRLKSFDRPETVWELTWDGRSRGEPGLRWLPEWFLGEPNRYIARPAVEAQVFGLFAKSRPDGRVPRLVTIHGFGGMGKTRLAIACALQAVGLFDGVFFVRLDDRLPTKESLAEAIGAAFGWFREDALPARILESLCERNCLAILDNFESVDCDDVRQFVGRLATHTRHLRLLVTGREAVKLDDAEYVIGTRSRIGPIALSLSAAPAGAARHQLACGVSHPLRGHPAEFRH
jgi:class 3 adenylate cyclase